MTIQLYVPIRIATGGPASVRDVSVSRVIPAFASEVEAQDALFDGTWTIIPYIAVPPAAPREHAWGDGQWDDVELAQGMRAAIRVTPAGDVQLTIPGGPLTITPGACQFGLGLLEASRRAAEIRARMRR